ncbi:MAG: Arc family DNA-binding protein [Methylocystis sp.]|uniref:Arc family DNA-binding protein n=1 Tax=Methylocystis sp. TaxID=1911079 RepID=UPI003DA2598B
MTDLVPITVRMPASERDWLKEQANVNCTSLNSEVVRALRERREKAEKRRARNTETRRTANAR